MQDVILGRVPYLQGQLVRNALALALHVVKHDAKSSGERHVELPAPFMLRISPWL